MEWQSDIYIRKDSAVNLYCRFILLQLSISPAFRTFPSLSSSMLFVPLTSHRPTNGLQGEAGKKDTWVRVVMALVLLGIVLVFMILECNGWWSGLQGAGGNSSYILVVSVDNCSKVGKELLQEGGNVVDGAVASLLCLGVVHPHIAGVGGAFSAILYNGTTGSLKVIYSTGPQVPSMPYGVPSILQGVRELHSRWGHSEWRSLFQGAIGLAEDGFLIDGILGRALEAHEDEITTSDLCDLFCNESRHLKSTGMLMSNRNLAELLRGASLNESHFPETLAMKLAEDLSLHERPAFSAAVQRSHGEINEPLIAEGEKYTVLSDTSPLTGLMLSVILERVREQSVAFQGSGDLNSVAASYASLFNLTWVLNNTGEKNLGSTDGVILSSFTTNISHSPYVSFPLVIKISTDSDPESDGDEGDSELEVIAVAGGLSAVFNAAILLRWRSARMTPCPCCCASMRTTLAHIVPLLSLTTPMATEGGSITCLSGPTLQLIMISVH
uniref:Gamma-glutamyltransferase 7 n=1 Tax=Electrophorus electricus TaxID=8005 RepID=A0A4W4EBT4_ELEEL